MLKRAVTAASLLALSLVTNAAIVQQSSITGADMAGMEVTVTFADSSTETGVWQVLTNTPLATGDPIIDANGFSGGVVASTWSLTQAGFSLGGFDDAGTPYGMWTISNLSSSVGIAGFTINGLTAASSIAFDIDSDAVQFPGSEFGQAFVAENGVAAVSSYTNPVDVLFTDLFWQIDVFFDSPITDGNSVDFFSDTDAMSVSTPATMGLLLGGLVLLSRRATRLAAK
jgi:hypothetical protein